MAQKQSKKAERGQEALVCTHGKCKKLQCGDGEFCEAHMLKSPIKLKNPIKYGDYGNKEDDELVELREELMDDIEKWLVHEFRIEQFHELLEVERELTLREDR